jgi:hypothetical protein
VGEVNPAREIAREKSIGSRYVSRMVNLTTLAPDIVAAILDETVTADVALWESAGGGSVRSLRATRSTQLFNPVVRG